MGIDGIGTNATTPNDTTREPRSSSASMDKEAFLKLLVAQISHQDPLKPMEGTEFVSQLSQFSVVEQAIQQTSKLDLLSNQMTGLASNEATALVGKDVVVRGRAIAFDGVSATGASVTLGAPASDVTVTLRDANGRAVRTMSLGPRGAGATPVTWDGRDDAGTPVPRGSYTLEVSAKNAAGDLISVSQDVRGSVVRVGFDKGYPEVTLDSGATAPVSDLVAVEAVPTSR
ncbi:MAG: flagellar hook assembly protein FlgD [Polyangiaceae bacterium]